jgi:predicted transcriptional regulator
MEPIDLTDDEAQVYRTVATLEAERDGVRIDEITRESGLDRSRAEQAVSALVSEHDLLRELSPGAPDLGPHYRVTDTAASAE